MIFANGQSLMSELTNARQLCEDFAHELITMHASAQMSSSGHVSTRISETVTSLVNQFSTTSQLIDALINHARQLDSEMSQ